MLPLFLLVLVLLCSPILSDNTVVCRDPDFGTHIAAHTKASRKYLLIGGKGAGIGNFLIFYPAAYYFAALTGRSILVIDDSLIGEMCKLLVCGFPLYSEVTKAFPSQFQGQMHGENVRGVKVYDFQRHFSREAPLESHTILRADGFKQFSGWYQGSNDSLNCIAKITSCSPTDISCHERFAFSRLVHGPFKIDSVISTEEKRLIGVPGNLRHAMMTLPHAYAPRLDAAIHLRLQFEHFEHLVGPEDPGWSSAIKEQDGWLNSTAHNAGINVFKVIEQKIMQDYTAIKSKQEQQRRGLRKFLQRHLVDIVPHNSSHPNLVSDENMEKEIFLGNADDDRIYVYLAADNQPIKEAFAHYLKDHDNIAVMRVQNYGHIAHAKNLEYVKGSQNNTGMMDLVVDWYALSLANTVYSFRRNSDMISTFAQSAQHLSRTYDTVEEKLNKHEKMSEDDEVGRGSEGLQLLFGHSGQPQWRRYW
jgi:hypothetical protein